MTRSRPDLVVCGQVVVAAAASGLELAEAVGIRDARVVSVGSRRDVTDAAAADARVLDFGSAAVVPGLHDFHLHLVGMARSSRALRLDDARDAGDVAQRVAAAAASLRTGAWLTGRGWTAAQLSGAPPTLLEDAVRGAPAFLTSHDGHSAWASASARRMAGVGSATPDPAGGRIERDADGEPTGVLRETALDLVAPHVPRLQGASLREPMDEVLRELASLGITGASEAGDYTDENGIGVDAPLGDSYSSLTDLADLVDGRLRLTLGIPADAIPAAAARGLRTGRALQGRRTMRFGWAKEYADGSIGSGTAALLTRRTCGDGDPGILRVTPEELDALFGAARGGGIGMAVHAIGDRAASAVLDAVARAGPRLAGVPPDRMEHAQLVRQADRPRFAELRVTASIQPIHAAADRDMVEDCWDGRQVDAFAWRSLAKAGVHLAAGSDAPVEDVNPWLGLFAAVHRRLPNDGREDWRDTEALDIGSAVVAYTRGPALAIGAVDEGHLHPGTRADLAVLTCDVATLRRADDALAAIRSQLTLVDGVAVHSTL